MNKWKVVDFVESTAYARYLVKSPLLSFGPFVVLRIIKLVFISINTALTLGLQLTTTDLYCV